MEDYKVKFERLIQRIDDLIANGWIDENAGKAILKDFAVESEDERIRKELISLVKETHITDRFYDLNKMLAWLEKQSEQKLTFCHHEVDFSDCSEEYRKAYYDGWNNCNQQHAQLKAEQKPAWSEEDEKLLKLSLENLTELKDRFGEKYGKASDCIHWLKSLKERYIWRPRDEQIEATKAMARYCDIATSFDTQKQRVVESLIDDLKKLKGE